MKLAQKSFDTFVMGYGKADITPVVSEKVGLAGNNDQHKRKVTGVLEPIEVNCAAFTDPDYITDHRAKLDGVRYENPGLPPVAVNNGFWQIKLLANGEETTLLVKDRETAEDVLQEKTPKLLRNEQNVVVGIQQ